MEKIKIPVILGPTGSGKSKLAMELARELNFSIISCDSRQIYQGMDIGTAKPSKRDQQEVKHYMIDIVKPNEEFSAYSFQENVLKIIREGHEKGEAFIVCGGTGLYFEALCFGVGPQLSTDPALIKEYTMKAENEGRESVYKELEKLDPRAAQKLHPNDLQRVIRALAVVKQEGVSIIDLQKRKNPPDDIEFYNLILIPPRDSLYKRINDRVGEMAKKGLFKEFKKLTKSGYSIDDPGMRSVGYQEFFNRSDDTEESISLVLDRIRQNSRKYAKRQYTWFNNRVQGAKVNSFDPMDVSFNINKIKIFLDITR